MYSISILNFKSEMARDGIKAKNNLYIRAGGVPAKFSLSSSSAVVLKVKVGRNSF